MREPDILNLLEELRRIAQLGLVYAKDPYDLQRYNDLLALASHRYANLSERPTGAILELFRNELGHTTPKVGVNAAIFSNGKLLISKRSDDGCWELPGGWSELGEGPREGLTRELREELSIEIEVGDIIDVFHRLPGEQAQPHTTYHLLFAARIARGTPSCSSEILDFKLTDMHESIEWHRDHGAMAHRAVEWLQREKRLSRVAV